MTLVRTMRAMRLLNAAILGNVNGAQMQALLADSSRLTQWQQLLTQRGQMRRMAANSTAMATVAASSTAMTAVAASSTAMAAVAASSTAMAAVAASSTAMTAVAASSTARDAVNASSSGVAAIVAAGGRSLVSWIVGSAGLNPDDYEDMAAVAASPTAMAAVAASPAAMAAMAAVAASSPAMVVFTGSTALPLVSVPVMTSNTTPSGVASALSEATPAWAAFDSLQLPTNRGWSSMVVPSWLQYEFMEPVFIHSMDLTGYSGNGMGRIPKNFSIQVSDNGSYWETLYSGINPQNTNKNTYSFAKAGKHKLWRISIENTHDGGPYPEIAQLNFRGFKI